MLVPWNDGSNCRDGDLRVEPDTEITPDLVASARRLPGFSLYHDLPWHAVLADSFGWQVRVATAQRAGRLIGYLPYVRKRRLGRLIYVCLPLSHDAGMLSAEGEAAAVDMLLSTLSPLELHGPVPGRSVSESISTEHVESMIDLTKHAGSDALFGAMASSRRRKIRHARRAEVVTVLKTDMESFEAFAELQSITRRRQGAPDYPRGFFPALARHLATHGKAEVRLGFVGGRPVAGVVLLIDRDRGRVIYGYGASIDDRDVLATGVNPLLMWEAMEQAHADGFKCFSLGSTAAHHEPLLTYKKRFGASVQPLARIRLPGGTAPGVEEGGLLNRIASPILSALPLSFFKRVTPLLLSEVI